MQRNNRAEAVRNCEIGCNKLACSDYKLAVTYFDQAVKEDPTYVDAYLNRSTAYFELKWYELALGDLNVCITLNPDNAIPFNNYGIICSIQKRHDLAIQYFTIALKKDPNTVPPHINRANSYIEQGEFDLAINDLTQALELDQDTDDAYTGRAKAYTYQGRHDLALWDLCKAIELNPYNALAYHMRGDIYRNQGLFCAAIFEYVFVLHLQRDNQIVKTKLQELLASNSKETVFEAIKMLPLNHQILLLKDALKKQTVLGLFFQTPEHSWRSKSVNYDQGILKDICDYLKMLDPGFIKPMSVSVTTNSIIGKKSNHNGKHVNREDTHTNANTYHRNM